MQTFYRFRGFWAVLCGNRCLLGKWLCVIMQAYLVSWYNASWWTRGGGIYNGLYVHVDHIPTLNTARNVIHVSQTVIEYYALCVPLYSNVNLQNWWISIVRVWVSLILLSTCTMIFDVVYVHSLYMSQYNIRWNWALCIVDDAH